MKIQPIAPIEYDYSALIVPARQPRRWSGRRAWPRPISNGWPRG